MSYFSKCLPWNPPSPNLETKPQNPQSGSQKAQKRLATWRGTKYLDEWWPERAWQLDSFFREAVASQSLTGFSPRRLGMQWNESNPTSTTQGKAWPSSKIQVVLHSEMMWFLSWSAVQLRKLKLSVILYKNLSKITAVMSTELNHSYSILTFKCIPLSGQSRCTVHVWEATK